ncbi:hypothetical protein M0802_011576 [Mischocyttarus mexicanus]|nr:hypothetical protein M0802_011576 [Mischocyttarus mexicanus]
MSRRKRIVVKPMKFNYFNIHCQSALLDFSLMPDDNYKFVFIYQYNLTKFLILHPLTTNYVKEIITKLINIFTIFGAPCILELEFDQESCNYIANNIKSNWPELNIISNSKYSQSLERVTTDIKNMLFTWMKDKKTLKWSKGLNFVQLVKNIAHHHDIKQSPFQAMFDREATVGIVKTNMLTSPFLTTEKDLECFLKTITPNTVFSFTSNTWILKCTLCKADTTNFPNSFSSGVCLCQFCERCQSIQKCSEKIEKCFIQEENTKLQSDTNPPDPVVDDTVNIPMPNVDKGKIVKISATVDLEIVEESILKLKTLNTEIKQLYGTIKSSLNDCAKSLISEGLQLCFCCFPMDGFSGINHGQN